MKSLVMKVKFEHLMLVWEAVKLEKGWGSHEWKRLSFHQNKRWNWWVFKTQLHMKSLFFSFSILFFLFLFHSFTFVLVFNSCVFILSTMNWKHLFPLLWQSFEWWKRGIWEHKSKFCLSFWKKIKIFWFIFWGV